MKSVTGPCGAETSLESNTKQEESDKTPLNLSLRRNEVEVRFGVGNGSSNDFDLTLTSQLIFVSHDQKFIYDFYI